MATQVSYPGVYIEEFAPAAPIEGVSTSIAAFIGIAEKGVIGKPTLVTSLDAITAEFGGSLAGPTPYYLALAVQGFFRNGGTTAYIIRVGTATAASADLAAASGSPAPVAGSVIARADGTAGNGGKVTVTHRNLAAPLPVHTATTAVTALDGTRRVLSVADSSGFQAGDVVVLTQNNTPSADRFTVQTVETGGVTLTADAPASNPEWDGLRTADLAVGDRRIRVDPGGNSLRALAATGSVVRIRRGNTTRWGVAAEVGADSITLATPLAAALTVSGATVDIAEFDLTIVAPDGTALTYERRSTSPTHPLWWGAVDDPYARVVPRADTFPPGDPRPAAVALTSVTGATPDDSVQAWLDVQSKIDDHLELLDPIDEVSLVVAPGLTDTAAQKAVIEHCERRFDRFAVLDAAKGSDIPPCSPSGNR